MCTTKSNKRRKEMVQGVIVRGGTYNGYEYVVVWSQEFNHAYIFQSDVNPEEWEEAMTCDWREFGIIAGRNPGPEGILTRAINLRRVHPGKSTNPCTTIDASYKDVTVLRSVKSFVQHEHTIKFRDTFKINSADHNMVSGEFIKNAKINPTDVAQLRKFKVTTFEAAAVLTYVVHQHDPSPWSIHFYIFEAKELSLHGFLAKKGHLRHGRGGVLVSAKEARIPPDTLKLLKPSKPSCFALPPKAPSEPQQIVNKGPPSVFSQHRQAPPNVRLAESEQYPFATQNRVFPTSNFVTQKPAEPEQMMASGFIVRTITSNPNCMRMPDHSFATQPVAPNLCFPNPRVVKAFEDMKTISQQQPPKQNNATPWAGEDDF